MTKTNTSPESSPILVLACAHAAHEANRAYCIAIGDPSQPTWDDAPDWQRSSAINGVDIALDGCSPAQSHEGWLREKEATGWVYGETKNVELKTHPCMVPHADLPSAQRLKDTIYITVVRAVAAALTEKETQ